MKRLFLASLVSATLIGCGGSDGDTSPSQTTREVTTNLNVLSVGESNMDESGNMVFRQTDSKMYEHFLSSGGNDICVRDERNREECNYVDVTDPSTWATTFNVLGEATFWLESRQPVGGYVQNYYWLGGEETITSDAESVTLKVSNQEWAYVTVDHHELISPLAPPELDDELPGVGTGENEMNHQEAGYYYKYISVKAGIGYVSIPLITGELLQATIEDIQPNKHYAFKISHSGDDYTHDATVGFEIIDKWEDPTDICIGKDCVIN